MKAPAPFLAIAALCLGAGIGLCSPAAAQPYPNKPIRIVVPYPAGGGIDILSRVVGQRLSQRFNQSVVVENKPGAGTIVAAEAVARAAADGYTLLVTTGAKSFTGS